MKSSWMTVGMATLSALSGAVAAYLWLGLAIDDTYFPAVPVGGFRSAMLSVAALSILSLLSVFVLIGMKLLKYEKRRKLIPVATIGIWLSATATILVYQPAEPEHFDRTFDGVVYHLPWTAARFGMEVPRGTVRDTVPILTLRFCSSPFAAPDELYFRCQDWREFSLVAVSSVFDRVAEATKTLASLKAASSGLNGGKTAIYFQQHDYETLPRNFPRLRPAIHAGENNALSGPVVSLKPIGGMVAFSQKLWNERRFYLFEPGEKPKHWAVCRIEEIINQSYCDNVAVMGNLVMVWPVPLKSQDQWRSRRDRLFALAQSYAK